MKVALLFFGQPRFLENPLPFQTHRDHILNKYETDVFCHTWWSPKQDSYDTSSWSKINSCSADKNAINKIVSLYNPKVVKFQESINFKFPEDSEFNKNITKFDWANNNKNNILSHLYSFTQIGEILEDYIQTTNTTYDFIIASRLDAEIIRLPNLKTLDPDKFYLPSHHDKFPDNLFLFSPKFIKFLNIYPNIEELSTKVWQPSAEAYKWENYKKHFEEPFAPNYNVYAEFVRNN